MAFVQVQGSHFETYATRMQGSLQDKLFFADQLDVDVLVDFGCADGALLRGLASLRPDLHLIGYDLSALALARARKSLRHGTFFADWAALLTHLHTVHRGRSVALLSSSVLHEVHSYGGAAAGRSFWARLRDGPFSHFVLRDMAIDRQVRRRYVAAQAAQVRSLADPALLSSFEAIWGPIDTGGRLTHFLLKYRYGDNWKREVAENYLPLGVETIVSRASRNFMPVFLSHEVLPYHAGCVQRDFGIAFPGPTHLKMIMVRR